MVFREMAFQEIPRPAAAGRRTLYLEVDAVIADRFFACTRDLKLATIAYQAARERGEGQKEERKAWQDARGAMRIAYAMLINALTEAHERDLGGG